MRIKLYINDLKRNKNQYYFELARGSSQQRGFELLESTVDMFTFFKRFFSYSAFQSTPYIPYFRIFRVFHHSVPSFCQSTIPPNSVTPDTLMSKKILNARLIIGPRIGRNELSFRDQDVPRSREQQYSNISLFFYLKEDIGH